MNTVPDGREAEELRAGIERLVKYGHEEVADLQQALRNLLDRVDARDSLSYLERLDNYKPFFQVQVADNGAVHVTVKGKIIGLMKGLSLEFKHDEIWPTAIARIYVYGNTSKYVDQLLEVPWMTIELLDKNGSHIEWKGRAVAGVTNELVHSCEPANMPQHGEAPIPGGSLIMQAGRSWGKDAPEPAKIELKTDGSILINGHLAENNKQVVEGMQAFAASCTFDIERTTGRRAAIMALLQKYMSGALDLQAIYDELLPLLEPFTLQEDDQQT